MTTSPHKLAGAVRAVLAGADLHTTARTNALEPNDLDEAVQVYRAAGLAALERRADHTWYQVRVQFTDWSTAEVVGATQLGPRLDQLHDHGTIGGWWFLRKFPCWRLRLRLADTAAVNRVLDELTTAGVIACWWPTVYEPETAAFGGLSGMDTTHDLFCADTHGVLDYLRHKEPSLGRRELSILLLNGLLHATGLDTFERGDVFHRVAQLRPTPADAYTPRIEELAENVRALFSIPVLPNSQPFTADGPVIQAAWLSAFHTAGYRLGDASAQGRLDRGLRAILTHIVIFHWNRLGLSTTSQSILAQAATTAFLPKR